MTTELLPKATSPKPTSPSRQVKPESPVKEQAVSPKPAPASPSKEAVKRAPSPVKEQPAKEWGPYDHPNFLIADLLSQCKDIEFKNEFEQNAKFKASLSTLFNSKAMSFSKAQSSILHWPHPVLNGKKAEKEIVGIGKAAATMIDEIIQNKCLVYKDQTLYPKGDVTAPIKVRPIEELQKGSKSKKKQEEEPIVEPVTKKQRVNEPVEEEESEQEEEEEEEEEAFEEEEDYEETESEEEEEESEDDYKPTKGKKRGAAPPKKAPAAKRGGRGGRRKRGSDDDSD